MSLKKSPLALGCVGGQCKRFHAPLDRAADDSMDFDLSREQRDIQRAAREFAGGEFDPELVLAWDLKQEFPSGVWKKACDLGFMGVHYPEEFGGQGLGLLENALVVEAFCRQDSGVGAALALSDFGAEMIAASGTRNQKEDVLPRLARGEALMTVATMEEGDDPGPYTTRATKQGTGFVIQGKKCWVPHGETAGYVIALARTGQDAHGGQTAFLLRRQAGGIETAERRERLGMRMIPLCDILFQAVRTPLEGVLGKEGEGTLHLKEFLHTARVECAAMGVGMAQGALDRAIEYGKRRHQFGRPIVAFESVRNRLADMYSLVETARLLVQRVAWGMDRGKQDGRLVLACKITAGHAALRVADEALQIHGGYGYMTEGHIEHFYRDARALDLFPEPGYRLRSLLAEDIVGR